MSSASGFSLANGDATPHPLDVLKIFNGGFLIRRIGEIYKCKSTFSARVPVQRQRAFADLAVLAEQVYEVLSFSVPGEIANEDRQKNAEQRLTHHRTWACPNSSGAR